MAGLTNQDPVQDSRAGAPLHSLLVGRNIFLTVLWLIVPVITWNCIFGISLL